MAVADWFTEKRLLDLVAPDVYVRGAAAAEHGAVQILEFDEAKLRARIDDTEVYEAEFHLHGDDLVWSCTCGQAAIHPCRHLVGAALATWPDEVPSDEE